MPSAIADLSLVLLKYSSILFINSQVLHLQKSIYDLHLALKFRDGQGILFTAAKVAVKALNIFLTCMGLLIPTANLFGFYQLASGCFALVVPLSRTGWLLGCMNESNDYFQNRRLGSELDHLNPEKRQKLIVDFQSLRNSTYRQSINKPSLALRLIRQSEGSTQEIFVRVILKWKISRLTPQKIEQIIKEFQLSLVKKNDLTETGGWLSAVGYASMHISKLYPEGILEWSLRWSLSMLYMIKSLHKKDFQNRLEQRIL